MLFSPSGRIAIAHYPKTGGTSLTTWFRRLYPDADYAEPNEYHMPVRMSLEKLGLVGMRGTHGRPLRRCLRFVEDVATRFGMNVGACDVRIIGVVREPFEMLVSLYEYWRQYAFAEEPVAELIHAARFRSFREFLQLAVGQRQLPNYEEFFDVGGPAWRNTRLLDFRSLESALTAVCMEFEITPRLHLERLNTARCRHRNIDAYIDEAGSFMFTVRKYFRWYYEEAASILIRGELQALKQVA